MHEAIDPVSGLFSGRVFIRWWAIGHGARLGSGVPCRLVLICVVCCIRAPTNARRGRAHRSLPNPSPLNSFPQAGWLLSPALSSLLCLSLWLVLNSPNPSGWLSVFSLRLTGSQYYSTLTCWLSILPIQFSHQYPGERAGSQFSHFVWLALNSPTSSDWLSISHSVWLALNIIPLRLSGSHFPHFV